MKPAPGLASPTYRSAIVLLRSGSYIYVRLPWETKMADARVEYERVDLRSYEARNGASLARSFKYKFSFPSMYRRLKTTQNRSVTSERKFEAKARSQNGAETPPEVKMALRWR